jgi:5-methylcytosine-specific restriction protein A
MEATVAEIITAKALAQRYSIKVNHCLYRRDGVWFHALRAFPGALFDRDGYILFPDEPAYLKCVGISHGPDAGHIHVQGGIRELSGYKHFPA